MCEYTFEELKELKYSTGMFLFCKARVENQSAPTIPNYSKVSNGARSKEAIMWGQVGLYCTLENGNLWHTFFFFSMQRLGQLTNCSLNKGFSKFIITVVG